MYCSRGDNGSGAEDFWGESAESIRARYEARVEELEAQVVAEKACRDRTYEQLSKAHARLESLELHFADEIAELEEQNHRLSEAWKQSRTETTVTSTPGQYISGPRLVTGYEYADLPHGPEICRSCALRRSCPSWEGTDDAEKGGA